MAAQWYYRRGDQQYGPHASEVLQRLARAGQLQPTDLVRKDGTEDWVVASRIKGLFTMPHGTAVPSQASESIGAQPSSPISDASVAGIETVKTLDNSSVDGASNGITPFVDWYKQKFGKQHIALQILLWLFYGFLWIPAWWLVTAASRKQRLIGGVVGGGGFLFLFSSCICCGMLGAAIDDSKESGSSANNGSDSEIISSRDELENWLDRHPSSHPHIDSGIFPGAMHLNANLTDSAKQKTHTRNYEMPPPIKEAHDRGCEILRLNDAFQLGDIGLIVFVGESGDLWLSVTQEGRVEFMVIAFSAGFRSPQTGSFSASHECSRLFQDRAPGNKYGVPWSKERFKVDDILVWSKWECGETIKLARGFSKSFDNYVLEGSRIGIDQIRFTITNNQPDDDGGTMKTSRFVRSISIDGDRWSQHTSSAQVSRATGHVFRGEHDTG